MDRNALFNKRRAAVSAALKVGPIDTAKRKILATEFACSTAAIYADVLSLTHDETRKYVPGTRKATRFVTASMKRRIHERDQGICQYCGTQSPATWIVEHVVPASRGGHAKPQNLVLACGSCNTRKRSEIWIPMNLSDICADDPSWEAWVRENSSPVRLESSRKSVKLDAESIATLLELGDNHLSVEIRRAAAVIRNLKQS